MAIQQDLLKIANEAENKPFVDYSNAFDPIMKEASRRTDMAIRSQDRAQMMKMREKQVADRRMRDYIDQKPNIDEELFDARHKEMYMPQMMQWNDEYFQNSKTLATADPNSEQYMNAKMSMDSALGKYKKIAEFLKIRKANSEAYMKDKDSNLISKGVSEEDAYVLDVIYGGMYDNVYTDENGKVTYQWVGKEDGIQYNVNEDNMPDYFLENAEAGSDYFDMWEKASNNALRYGTPFHPGSTRIKMNQIYKKHGREVVLYLAYDDIGATTTTFAELYPDTDWRKEDTGVLQDKLTEYYSKVMQDSDTTNQGSWQSRQKGKNNDKNQKKDEVTRTKDRQEQ